MYKSVGPVSCAASTSALCYRDLKSACVKTKVLERVWHLYWKWMFCVCLSHECILWLFSSQTGFFVALLKKNLLTISHNLLATTTPLPPFVKIICSQVCIHFWIWCKNYAVFYKNKRNNSCISINGVIFVKLKHIYWQKFDVCSHVISWFVMKYAANGFLNRAPQHVEIDFFTSLCTSVIFSV